VQQIDNVDLYQKILDLQSEVMELCDENAALKAQVKHLSEKFGLKESLVFEKNFYWLPEQGGESKSGPFCSSCWDSQMNLIRLVTVQGKYYGCPTCGRIMSEEGSLPEPRTVAIFGQNLGK